MESDNEYYEFINKLTDAVKKHELIYDKKHPFYYHKHERKKSWCSIAAEIGETLVTCQRRWNLCREKYAKELNKRSRALAAGKNYQSNWPSFEKFSFIEDQYTPRRRSIARGRYKFVPKFRDEKQSNTPVPHSTSDSNLQQTQENEQTLKDNILHQPKSKRYRAEESNYSISESTFSESENIDSVKDKSCNIKVVNINDMTDEPNVLVKVEDSVTISDQEQIQEYRMKVDHINAPNADKIAQSQKESIITTSTKDFEDSDALFGKMVTTMLKEIRVEDIKDEVKLNIFQSLIRAKREANYSTQD